MQRGKDSKDILNVILDLHFLTYRTYWYVISKEIDWNFIALRLFSTSTYRNVSYQNVTWCMRAYEFGGQLEQARLPYITFCYDTIRYVASGKQA